MDKWPSIDPGELRNPVTIQSYVETRDSNGAMLQSWKTFAKARARIDPYGGGEKWLDEALHATNMFKMWMRYIPGVNVQMRVLFEDRVFDIKNIENVLERKVIMVLTCLERLYDATGVRVQ